VTHKCPICRMPTDSEIHTDFPFCSERCRQTDLGNWAAERYVISEPTFDEEALEKLILQDPPDENESQPQNSEKSDK
jgi:uncharacterized protein